MSGRLEMCLRELNDAGMMNLQLDNLNDEMEKTLMLLQHLSAKYFPEFFHNLISDTWCKIAQAPGIF